MTADEPLDAGSGPGTPFDALEVIGTQQVQVTPALRHIELYTMRGLLTLLWHDPPADHSHAAGIVLCGGAMGGLLGPADGMYHRLGVEWAARGVAVVRVSYRRPNDLEACTIDVAAAVQLLSGAGADRVVTMGHSFGGAAGDPRRRRARPARHGRRHVRHPVRRLRGRRRSRRQAAAAVPRRARRDSSRGSE